MHDAGAQPGGEAGAQIYGTTTLAPIEASCRVLCALMGRELRFHQSNHEGALIDWIHEAREGCEALVINPPGCPSANCI